MLISFTWQVVYVFSSIEMWNMWEWKVELFYWVMTIDKQVVKGQKFRRLDCHGVSPSPF